MMADPSPLLAVQHAVKAPAKASSGAWLQDIDDCAFEAREVRCCCA